MNNNLVDFNPVNTNTNTNVNTNANTYMMPGAPINPNYCKLIFIQILLKLNFIFFK
jgi:hypothetical protein